jgi:hypothetical protein
MYIDSSEDLALTTIVKGVGYLVNPTTESVRGHFGAKQDV